VIQVQINILLDKQIVSIPSAEDANVSLTFDAIRKSIDNCKYRSFCLIHCIDTCDRSTATIETSYVSIYNSCTGIRYQLLNAFELIQKSVCATISGTSCSPNSNLESFSNLTSFAACIFLSENHAVIVRSSRQRLL